mgnify:CR=1 FL=1
MIGVFDSGVGGLTVVREVVSQIPEQRIIYFGDTAHLPYGTKGENFVKTSSEKITKWLIDKGANIIVIACNTSSSWASDYLKEKFENVPIFEMVSPVAKEIDSLKKKKIGIIGTPGTIESKAYNKKLLEENPNLEIFSKACPLLVPLAEEGWIEEKATKEIIKKYLAPLEKEIEVLILACTHYPLLEKAIREVLSDKIEIVNPAKSLAGQLRLFLKENPEFNSNSREEHQFYFSDKPYNLKKISELCFPEEINPVILKPLL